MHKKINNKGQFSIIAAIFVTVILISTVMITYSSIRYTSNQSDPQILSAIDETNLALKQVLGFTVGYYGSVLQVTGNSSYAKTLASNYLSSGLENIANMKPEWGSSFEIIGFDLSTNWFTNNSYSEGILTLNYSLAGLGVSGITYSASSRLDVDIYPSESPNQVCLSVYKDEGFPISNLVLENFKFYRYRYNNLTWETVNPEVEPLSFANGTYLINVPSGINQHSYSIQVQDSRGIMVAASSFSHYSGTLTFNSTFVPGGDYVDLNNVAVDGKVDVGSNTNFGAQKAGPDSTFDTLTAGKIDTSSPTYYPTGYSLTGSTSLVSGGVANLAVEDSNYVRFRSYPSQFGSNYNAVTFDNQNSAVATSGSSMSWQHTTGAGNDRLLLVAVDVFRNSGGNPRTVTGVTYDGNALTQGPPVVSYSSDPRINSYLYYLTNPAAGTKTITVSFSGNLQTSAIGGSVTYTNVDQVSPIQTSGTNSGSSNSPTVSVAASGSHNKVLFGHVATYNSASSYNLNDIAGQTTRWSQTSSAYKAMGSDKTVTSGGVSMSWNPSRAVSWTTIAVVLQPTRQASEQTCEVEFSGSSNTANWNSLLYAIDSLSSINNVNMVIQLFNYQTGQYPPSGTGYTSFTLGTTHVLTQQSIVANPTIFRDALGLWKLKFKAVFAGASPFDISIDFAKYQPSTNIYALNLQEQWTNLNMTYLNPHPALCINTASPLGVGLGLDVWSGGAWRSLSNSLVSGWNNFSISAYLTPPQFTIRLRVANNTVQNNWAIDAALLRPESDQELFKTLQDSTAVVTMELLQNGTMRWLGQNMTLTTEDLQVTNKTIPIPPVPVKALHINETIEVSDNVFVDSEVPFQIEDWASDYTVPLGLTNNNTVFGNRQMVVFLLNTRVTKFTVWWNGSDEATQTPLAFTNTRFTTDNPSGGTLSNGKLQLSFGGGFTVTSTVVATGTQSTSTFMRINNQASTYGAGVAYVIHHGVVRDVIQQEAEWGNGVTNCPNLYANIVLTLPANASYYTYQLSLMFINSAQARSITDLCPIKVACTAGSLQTENGTILGDPVVVAGSQTFNASGVWGHRWSQFTDGTKGAGIMFTNSSNKLLYAFDSMPTAALRGALKADSTSPQNIQLLPVTLNSVSFQTPLNIAWSGAVATFDGTVTIYGGAGLPGLWILASFRQT